MRDCRRSVFHYWIGEQTNIILGNGFLAVEYVSFMQNCQWALMINDN